MNITRGAAARCASAAAATLLFLGPSLRAQVSGPVIYVRAANTLTIGRPDETIGIPWNAVTQRLHGATPADVRVTDVGSSTGVISQVVDDDGDGNPDELIFQANFDPLEARSFTVSRGTPVTPALARVFVMHTTPRDDIAWESDRIAFRMYGQGLWKVDSLFSSGVDVWVKRVRYPIVQKWYAKGHDAYHQDTGEGADFFDVGQSLGAGGAAIWRDDSLYRAANFKSYRIIANGPVRVIFELQYEPWEANGLRVSETKRISLDAGQNLNHVVSVFRASDATTNIPFVLGLVKRKGAVGSESKASTLAWLSEWGPVSPKDGGHGELGTAIVLQRRQVDDWKETGDHYLAVSHARSGTPVSYYIGAGWTGSGDFPDVESWWRYLDRFAQRTETPLSVSLSSTEPRR